ncbi:DHA2 family efflux MFS transporter permease subunit [uncultured Sphaerochaeta sp.]|uniref:DHA2 family efflux MFS transporter permease subunit n=1 Tax=uncultured Sphaerochaeta sp. TaxID=886478 RepID=UPI002AA6E22B|nr:DHA2 family efflux MFS transporter permease subunit [uncultured Sphaerochaeta sp.]
MRKQDITIMKLGVFLGLLGETFLNAALVQCMDVFQVTADTVQWLTSGYMLTMGICVPVSAYLIKRMTTKNLYLSALGVFLLGTLVAGLSPWFSLLLVGRVIQAIGASIMLPMMMHAIMVSYEPSQRGAAMGSAMLIVLFAPAIGPTFGGLIIGILSWRWIFFSIVPIILIGMFWALQSMEQTTVTEKIHFDCASVVLSIVGFGGFVYGLESLFSQNSLQISSLLIFIAGIIALGIFVLRQLRLDAPMLDIRVLGNGMYSLGVCLIMMTHMTMFANFIMMPMFLVNMLGLSTFLAGLAVLPGGFMGAVLPPIAGKIYDRIGPRGIVSSGFLLLACMNFLISTFSASTSIIFAIISYIGIMVSVAVILTPAQTNSLSQLQKQDLPHGTAVLNTLMLIGASMGASFFVGIMSAKTHTLVSEGVVGQLSLLGGLHFAYRGVGILCTLGFVLALFLRNSEEKEE